MFAGGTKMSKLNLLETFLVEVVLGIIKVKKGKQVGSAARSDSGDLESQTLKSDLSKLKDGFYKARSDGGRVRITSDKPVDIKRLITTVKKQQGTGAKKFTTGSPGIGQNVQRELMVNVAAKRAKQKGAIYLKNLERIKKLR
jgi:hypothetical protein